MIPFTQFKRPNGRPVKVTIDRPPLIEKKAEKLIKAGCQFQIEVLMTEEINMEALIGDTLLAGELCQNGPEVPVHVDKMIERAYAAVGFTKSKSAAS